jgi:hypothetical protein
VNAQERGQAVRRIIDVAFPDLPRPGCVGTAMALDHVAGWARAELQSLPELAAISSGMKHNTGIAELADVVFASRPTADPHEVVFGLPGAKVGSGEYVQPFVTASTDGRPARYYDGLPEWMQERGALRHINGFAAEYEPDYGFYRTSGGHPRVAEHHPSSSSINDEQILKRYEAARTRALTPKGTVGRST